MIYKILTSEEWAAAKSAGEFTGSPVDLNDGFIHFSSAEQVVETAAKHFAGLKDLVLVGVDERQLGEALRWEVSRRGALFPHLYGILLLDCVASVNMLMTQSDGTHRFPQLGGARD